MHATITKVIILLSFTGLLSNSELSKSESDDASKSAAISGAGNVRFLHNSALHYLILALVLEDQKSGVKIRPQQNERSFWHTSAAYSIIVIIVIIVIIITVIINQYKPPAVLQDKTSAYIMRRKYAKQSLSASVLVHANLAEKRFKEIAMKAPARKTERDMPTQ